MGVEGGVGMDPHFGGVGGRIRPHLHTIVYPRRGLSRPGLKGRWHRHPGTTGLAF